MQKEQNQEHREFFCGILGFARKELAPRAAERDEAGAWDSDAFGKLASFGLAALPFQAEFGGSDASAEQVCLAYEALGYAGVDLGTLLSLGAHTILCGIPLHLFGSPSQKERYLGPLAAGQMIGGFGLTEPDAGSDAGSLRTRARRLEDGSFLVNGAKMFITNGPVGSIFTVICRAEDEAGQVPGAHCLLIGPEHSGFSVGKVLHKLGHRSSPTSELVFEQCRVPAENLLGPAGQGFSTVAKAILEWERICLLAPTIGAWRQVLELSLRYALDRRQFGQPIAAFEPMQAKLGAMVMRLEAARCLLYAAARTKDSGMPAVIPASLVKLFASEAFLETANDAVQMHGGYGYTEEFSVARYYRDAKLLTIGGGTSEIQRQLIGRAFAKQGPELAKSCAPDFQLGCFAKHPELGAACKLLFSKLMEDLNRAHDLITAEPDLAPRSADLVARAVAGALLCDQACSAGQEHVQRDSIFTARLARAFLSNAAHQSHQLLLQWSAEQSGCPEWTPAHNLAAGDGYKLCAALGLNLLRQPAAVGSFQGG